MPALVAITGATPVSMASLKLTVNVTVAVSSASLINGSPNEAFTVTVAGATVSTSVPLEIPVSATIVLPATS
ncbi:hypothetical protein Rcae01_06481 [Novipirellula caenicola]|uniref:Uncharacterized protein n=2 Tax=Novipirellula caenicola TaxID=1536901 RepID=A0ABP9W0R9_9BACT